MNLFSKKQNQTPVQITEQAETDKQIKIQSVSAQTPTKEEPQTMQKVQAEQTQKEQSKTTVNNNNTSENKTVQNSTNETPWYEIKENKEMYPTLCYGLKIIGVNKHKVSISDIENVVNKFVTEGNKITKQNKVLGEQYRQLLDKYNKLSEQLKASGLKTFKKGQGGRKQKNIDWAKYDRLKAEGATQEQIASIMKVGVSTLRKKLKAKQKENTQNVDTKK